MAEPGTGCGSAVQDTGNKAKDTEEASERGSEPWKLPSGLVLGTQPGHHRMNQAD